MDHQRFNKVYEQLKYKTLLKVLRLVQYFAISGFIR
jgi:hypothetical protein